MPSEAAEASERSNLRHPLLAVGGLSVMDNVRRPMGLLRLRPPETMRRLRRRFDVREFAVCSLLFLVMFLFLFFNGK